LLDRLLNRVRPRSGEHLPLGGVKSPHRCSQRFCWRFVGLPVFEGFLARPFQESGYRSRPSFVRSRSVQ
jgi:hypothetical protein